MDTGADYSFEAISIETYAPQFFLGSVDPTVFIIVPFLYHSIFFHFSFFFSISLCFWDTIQFWTTTSAAASNQAALSAV